MHASLTLIRAETSSRAGRKTMCRMMVFRGYCTCCGTIQTWSDLTQELSCLDAKNTGWFGGCQRGILVEEHSFDQECAVCYEEDEGIGDLDVSHVLPFQHTSDTQSSLKRRPAEEHDGASGDSKKQRT
ncbi:hypothetical protein F66182_7721 [Fusarium sp. NRRL 66182]|nr:hypothetical protein F66182_7721 [Fusarium sp. NRRL 66182]